jgi:hypothetical protein
MFMAVSPPIALFATFYISNFLNGRRVISLGIDKKYGL